MKKEVENKDIEKDDLMGILFECNNNELEEQFFLSKKKLINAQVK